MTSEKQYDPEILRQLTGHYQAIIRLVGEDPTREGLVKTPERAAKAFLDITAGYHRNPLETARKAIFENSGSGIVIVKDIEFYSICEHHLLPFFGKISVGYIPDGKILGLSKVARIVDCFARRLQVQERLTRQVCELLSEAMPNKGVIVACTAEHLCMKMRGVEKQDSATTTFEYSGSFNSDSNLRNEFMQLIAKN